MLAFCYGMFIIGRTMILGVDVPGYASVLSLLSKINRELGLTKSFRFVRPLLVTY